MIASHTQNLDMAMDPETPRGEVLNSATGEEVPCPSPTVDDEATSPNLVPGRQQADARRPGRAGLDLRRRMNLATWNVRTLHQTGRLYGVTGEMSRCSIDILGLAEVRWTGSGFFKANTGHLIVYSGGRQHMKGVAVAFSPAHAKCMLEYNPVSDRVVAVRTAARPFPLTFIQVYAPTSAAPEEEIVAFYDSVQRVIDEAPTQDFLIVAGDFNSKVGQLPETTPHAGRFGLGEQNERGERLLDFCRDNDLVVTNTCFSTIPAVGTHGDLQVVR